MHLQACVLQAADNLSVALVGKVSDDIIRYLLAHILHRYQLLSVGNLQLLQRCEAACQFLRCGLAHHAYADGEEYTLPWHEQAVGDTIEDILRRLLAEALLRGKVVESEGVDVGDVMEQSLCVQQVDGLFA